VDDGLGGEQAYCLWEDEERLWVGTTGGASYYDGKTWHTVTVEDGLLDNEVFAVLGDSQGRMWFGTGQGVSVYDIRAQKWQTYVVQDGLAGPEVRSILEDHTGSLWFGTRNGLSRFDGQNWVSYRSENSGLPDDQIHTIVQDSRGRILFGTGAWYTAYVATSVPPQPHIDSVISLLDRRQFAGTMREITLSHSHNAVGIEFSAHDLATKPKDMAYRYWLEGPKADHGFVHPPSAREKRGAVEFYELPPGHYVFALEAGNRNLDYSQPITVAFDVRSAPPVVSLSWVGTKRWVETAVERVIAEPDLWKASQLVTFKFAGSDDVTGVSDLRYRYLLEGPDMQSTNPLEIDETTVSCVLVPGVYTITVQAIDEDGNSSAAVSSVVAIPWPRMYTVGPFVGVVVLVAVLSFVVGSLAYRRSQRERARRSLFNPYRDGPPITEVGDFFGRQQDLQKLLVTVRSLVERRDDNLPPTGRP